ncbi:MAG: transglycosylase family protein, partial [bacterium]|nr:transglycosylase family protein [bacterium]
MRTFPSAAAWEALRQCESLGDYGFVHLSGQYFGAYQFTVSTWDRLARQRYTELRGVLPSEAAPADQDRLAYYLWIESGAAPWPGCRHAFTVDSQPEGATEPSPPPPDGVTESPPPDDETEPSAVPPPGGATDPAQPPSPQPPPPAAAEPPPPPPPPDPP